MAERCISQSNSPKLRELVRFGPLVTTPGCCPSWTRFRSSSCSHAANKRCICVACKWKHTIFYFTSSFINLLSLWFKISKSSCAGWQPSRDSTSLFTLSSSWVLRKWRSCDCRHIWQVVIWKTAPARFLHLYRTFQPGRTPPSAALWWLRPTRSMLEQTSERWDVRWEISGTGEFAPQNLTIKLHRLSSHLHFIFIVFHCIKKPQ